MGQYWKLVNIDARQELANDGGLKFKEILWNRMTEQLVDLLQVPGLRRYKFSDVAVARAKTRTAAACPLASFPQEIIDAIVGIINDGVDVIALCLTNTYFFRLLAARLSRAVQQDEAPWAGHRLVLVGDYASGFPPGCMTEEEEMKIRADVLSAQGEHTGDRRRAARFEVNPLYAIPEHAVCGGLEPAYDWEDRAVGQPIRRARAHRLSGAEMALLDRLLSPMFQTADPVLRNLTSKQYIRDATLAESRYAYSLGEAICVFATWTDDGPEGAWAGHRFDIADFAEVNGKGGWTDVGQEAVDELRSMDAGPRSDGRRAK